jgi:hypothetical protein
MSITFWFGQAARNIPDARASAGARLWRAVCHTLPLHDRFRRFDFVLWKRLHLILAVNRRIEDPQPLETRINLNYEKIHSRINHCVRRSRLRCLLRSQRRNRCHYVAFQHKGGVDKENVDNA